MSKKAERNRQQDEEAHQFMAVWCWATGTTYEDFIAEIERVQSDTSDPTDFMGLDAGITSRVFETGLHPNWAFEIIRAMQHLAITRPWRQQQAKGQADLFASV
ncbi:hypothetical protein VP03_23100 [Sinorhizobium meliloti]|uniref:hypothetical protein n=1 Tax=Rhizobium meliloti TaxID=382 RepID=UPI0006148E61|nr:hypothetical protein [Sinorhizobium meliloti]KKA11585.1 hypothetical protein VP03_23100 [Sinorhizobium meliloti]